MWGSDWPPVTLGGGYGVWWEATQRALATQDEAARDAVLGGTAARFYWSLIAAQKLLSPSTRHSPLVQL